MGAGTMGLDVAQVFATKGFEVTVRDISDEILDAAKAKLLDGSLKVFDTATFTVEGKTLTSYMADVNTDAAYEPDTEVITDGAFAESKFRSAPYFNVEIDGITLLDRNYG